MAVPKVLLIVGGGVAAYKALELVRLMRKDGMEVRAILTEGGSHFVTPLSLASLTENPVGGDLFDLTAEQEMGHIVQSRWADLIVVAPATADLMAKAANGLANDLASTTLLATDTPVLMAPAMNVRMWTHPATQRNLAQLKADGVAFVGPDEGEMACGEFGEGRLAEPPVILNAIRARIGRDDSLKGRHILITAGPTEEPLDPVRFLSNRSSGKQGYAIASALERRGATVTLISGPTALPAPAGVTRVQIGTAEEMLAACKAALPAQVAIMTAAVADWRPAEAAPEKLKDKATRTTIELVANPDILAQLAKDGPDRPALVIGFAAETEKLIEHARGKLAKKGCDWIVANDVGGTGVMGGDANTVTLIDADGEEAWPRLSKAEVAERLAERIAKTLG
ncbi:bifunctional phosphopantothenoylcysteine decarboxylase/phosphopantothenate--cysteine ligase CoaBC [Brevundimonas aveniformis]|uniref:bifunctional phosphopantothenoylcysteine decarboxylase/phosphopantothenate--cysteine ligase CoaBC n=1 Tax=Brevundimonas aveniformis TaxID=370977 RepID=UPI00048B9000|nr:bifunctional phosphopantothenoylcysteine decarboxylase/phosphopantothenate--cysteine ligase CoaBC [Brevundimonas aveniformis]